MIISINPENPQERLIRKVADILRGGGLVIYPTDTQYGLGCDLRQKKAIEKIYRLKRRNEKSPFSFVCADLTDIAKYAKVSDFAYRTMKRLLPGPYTFILDGTKLVPQLMLTKRKECGIRVPKHPIALELVKALESPIINTSALLPDHEPPTGIYEVEDMFKGQVDVIIEGGPVPGQPSTIVSLIGDDPVLVREGLGPYDLD